ncbi:GLPGLI family protein [Mucilaginibacter ginsenosidivorans]|uniref:GLPGLI family protein n=1 Tax=Mucilaginibacter ginsenosidivorans TaxID=398053 RepID=A0A5B8UX89_9SPHI|nr:GLPGLI family protein [Mucilaginibacter ginsenosidivorans]QEC63006.1 GLPGLI family protein [Mucilaginibacter ginsenosidivorans]
MKRLLLLTTLLLMVFISAEAQNPDTARLMVHYKFSWVRDTANREHPYTENMVLYVGQSAGAYRSYDGVVYKAQFKKAFAEAVAASPDGHPMINRRGVGSNVEYYQYPNQQKLLTKDQLMANSYAIEGPLPAIAWKTTGDTATFGGLHCQKATGHFKGRDYSAWFCPDLPVRTGPWKLNGLPGVIVDARDAKNEVVFQFDGVEKTVATSPGNGPAVDKKDLPPILRDLDDDMNLIAPPLGSIKTTQKDFDKLQEAMRKNPNGVVQAVNAGNGPKMDHVKMGPPLKGPVINNPMELPEKK